MSAVFGEYAVIRFIPDHARHEVFNLGLVAWTTSHWLLRFDPDASERIAREHPFLASDYFTYLEAAIRERLQSMDKPEAQAILDIVRSFRVSQMSVSDPLFFAIPNESFEDFSSRVDDLIKRLVTPRAIR